MRKFLFLYMSLAVFFGSMALAQEKAPSTWDTETFSKHIDPLRTLFRDGKYDELIGPMDSIYTHAPLTPNQRTTCEELLGEAYFHVGKYDQSIEYLGRAWKAKEGDPEIYFYVLAARLKSHNLKQGRMMLYNYFKTGSKDLAPIIDLAGREMFDHPAIAQVFKLYEEEVKVDLDKRSFMGVPLGTSREEMAEILKVPLKDIPRSGLFFDGRHGTYWLFDFDEKDRVRGITVNIDVCEMYTIQHPRLSNGLTLESTLTDVKAVFGEPDSVITEGRRYQYVDEKGILTFVFGGTWLQALSSIVQEPEKRTLSGISMEVSTNPAPVAKKPEEMREEKGKKD